MPTGVPGGHPLTGSSPVQGSPCRGQLARLNFEIPHGSFIAIFLVYPPRQSSSPRRLPSPKGASGAHAGRAGQALSEPAALTTGWDLPITVGVDT